MARKINFRALAAIVVVFAAIALVLRFVISGFVWEAISAADSVMIKMRPVLPFTPLILYGIFGVIIRKHLWAKPRDKTVEVLDRQEASSLSLAGFCFTSLSLLVSFYKDEIKGGTAPLGILWFFAIALVCFVASYMTLRYRTKNLFQFLNEGLLDNGLWCVLLGFWTFFIEAKGLAVLSAVFTAGIVVYGAYLILHFIYWIVESRKPTPTTQPAAVT